MQVAKVNFNDCIGNDFLFGGISESFVRYCVEGPNSFDPAAPATYPKEVELHFFNCPGGEVYEGYAIYSYLRTVAQAGVKVTAHIHGLCASIASLVVLAADERRIGPLGSVMIHKPLVDAGPWANADDHRKAAADLDQIEAQIAAIYTSRTSIDAATLPDLMRAETFFTASEAVANGFATALLADAAPEAAAPAPKVLNYAKPKPAPAMAAMTEKEEKGLFDKFMNWAGLKPKNEGEPTPPPVPPVTNTSIDVTGGDPMYFDGSELAQGTAVYSDEAMTTAYADGDYALADGRDVTVAGGTVETLADATADDTAANLAAETAKNAALETELAAVKAENALNLRKLTAAQNRLAQVVPGSGGNPTPPGSAQNIGTKVAAGVATNHATSPVSIGVAPAQTRKQ